VISDAHEGLQAAVTAVLHGAAWQRCRVHFVRNALALVPKTAAPMVAATIRTVFVQPDAPSAREQWRRVADSFRPRFPRLAELLDAAEPDVLAYLAFPAEHWRQLWSTNPLERVNQEIKRRTDVVGIFPNDAVRLRGCEFFDALMFRGAGGRWEHPSIAAASLPGACYCRPPYWFCVSFGSCSPLSSVPVSCSVRSIASSYGRWPPEASGT
jgi:hypothetical protein